MGEASAREMDWVVASAFTLTLPLSAFTNPVPARMSALLSLVTKATATEPTSCPWFLVALPVVPMLLLLWPGVLVLARKVAFTFAAPAGMTKM